jgi:hypothetical protein
MTDFEFKLFCSGVDTDDDSFLDRLYEADCDDATVFFKDGYVCLDFTRESENAESAVVSAIRDFERSGIGGTVERVEPEDLASLSEIASRVGVTRASLQKYARGESKVGKDFPAPVQNISVSRRELFSTVEVMRWMMQKKKSNISRHSLDLCTVIAKTNQALLVSRARKDELVSRLVERLAAPVQPEEIGYKRRKS